MNKLLLFLLGKVLGNSITVEPDVVTTSGASITLTVVPDEGVEFLEGLEIDLDIGSGLSPDAVCEPECTVNE